MKRTSAACLCHLNPHKSCCVTSIIAPESSVLSHGVLREKQTRTLQNHWHSVGDMGSCMFPYTVPDALKLPWMQFFFFFPDYFLYYLQSFRTSLHKAVLLAVAASVSPLSSSATSTLWLTPGPTVIPSDSLKRFWVIFLLSRRTVPACGGQMKEWHKASWILLINAGTSAGKQ